MKLRYAGSCRVCGAGMAAGTLAVYERFGKTVRCLSHDGEGEAASGPIIESAPEPIEEGTPGASARREFERRRQGREDRIRSAHPKIGGLILALSDDPQATKAWDTGALGEERLGSRLNEIAGETLQVLHDRRIPRSRANIDHLAVTGTGVWVIDAKKYRGRPELKVEGGFLRPRVQKLLVGGRECTRLVDGVEKQVDLVRDIVAGELPVRGVLCFVEADWPLIGGAFRIREVEALWPKKLYTKLREPGPLDAHTIASTHKRLATTLRPA
jgi:Nuclease-related domain